MSKMKILCMNFDTAYEKILLADFNAVHFDDLAGPIRDDLMTKYEKCSEIVKKEDIGVILAFDDHDSLVIAAIKDEVTSLRGPTLESQLILNNKYYTREFLGGKYNLKYNFINIDELATAFDAENTIGYPMFIKPVSECSGNLIAAVTCRDEMLNYLGELKEQHLDKNLNFLEKFADEKRFPLTKKNIVIAEELVDRSNILTVCVDAVFSNGNVIPWSIADAYYCNLNQNCRRVKIIPTCLDQDQQKKVWNVIFDLSTRMVKHGFDNESVNFDLFVFPDGDIKLIEINGRFCRTNHYMYAKYFEDPLCNIKAVVDVKSGRSCEPPKALNTTTAFYYMSCFGCGLADEFFDYDLAAELVPDKDILEIRTPKGSNIDPVGDNGTVIARIFLEGRTRVDCEKQFMEIANQICKQKEFWPFLSG